MGGIWGRGGVNEHIRLSYQLGIGVGVGVGGGGVEGLNMACLNFV